jgi:hypothetical protein
MSRHTEPTDEQRRLWQEWLNDRPPHVKAVAEKFDPWTLYKMTSTGQRVFVVAFDEQDDDKVTVTVGVSGQFNFVTHERNVFGIDPNDLTECDLPSEQELTGNMDLPDEVLRVMLAGGST